MKSLIILILFMCGCASTQQTNTKQLLVVIDNSFDIYQIEKIQDALARWEKKAKLNLKVEVQDVSGDRVRWSYDEIITIYNAEEGWRKKVYNHFIKSKNVLSMMVVPSKDIFIRNVFKMYKTAMHEFGHALGCQEDYYNKWNIMYYKIQPTMSDISWKDLKTVRKNNKEYLK